ncbi:MAG: glycosyltransferase family 2 protein [Bacillota bacterium]
MKVKNSPTVSIITPSYNQGKFIRETIESVLSQDFKDIEHIVVDGGSTDETLSILREYSKRDARFRFISEKDNGQSHAINKGFKMAKGQIIGWLNSDDTYLPGAISNAFQMFNNRPDYSMVYGDANITDVNNQIIMRFKARHVRLKDLFRKCPISQPAVFMKKKMLEELGGVDEKLDFCMDYELWIRIAKKGYGMGRVPTILANSRYYPESKSGSKYAEVGFPEIISTSQRHFGTVSRSWMKIFLLSYPTKGFFWALNLLRATSIFSNSPAITNFSKKKSGEYSFQVSNNPEIPFSAIVMDISGHENDELNLNIYKKEDLFHTTILNKDSAPLLIPISLENNGTRVSITSNKKDFSINNIAALSLEEKTFTEAYKEGEPGITRWINQNFKFN